ncbi:MAG: AIR synthase-related protein [Planctomycetota bacterium]
MNVPLTRQGATNTFQGNFNAPPNSGSSSQLYDVKFTADDTAGNQNTIPCGDFSVAPFGSTPPTIGNCGIAPVTLPPAGGAVTITADVSDSDGVKSVQARITLPGGELAQIGSMLKGAVPGRAFDVAGFVVGLVALDRINTGKDVRAGDVVIGFHSSGLHSNGYSLARKALLEKGGLKVGDRPPELGGKTLGDVLLEPTKIYVKPIVELLKTPGLRIGALAHITGDGFLNMARIEAPMGFVLDRLPPPPPIFGLIQKKGGIATEELYVAFNMGIGFTVTVGAEAERLVLDVAKKHGYAAQVIGKAVPDPKRRIQLPAVGLVGDADERRFDKS